MDNTEILGRLTMIILSVLGENPRRKPAQVNLLETELDEQMTLREVGITRDDMPALCTELETAFEDIDFHDHELAESIGFIGELIDYIRKHDS